MDNNVRELCQRLGLAKGGPACPVCHEPIDPLASMCDRCGVTVAGLRIVEEYEYPDLTTPAGSARLWQALVERNIEIALHDNGGVATCELDAAGIIIMHRNTRREPRLAGVLLDAALEAMRRGWLDGDCDAAGGLDVGGE